MVQCGERKFDVLAAPKTPSQPSAIVLVHPPRQVSVDGADFKVSDVAHPDPVRLAQHHIELTIGDEREVAPQLRIGVAQRSHSRFDTVYSHEARDPVLAHAAALTLQRPVYTRTAVGAVARTVNFLNLFAQDRIGLCALAWSALSPAIIPGARHAIYSAHQGNLVFGPVCFDEFEDFPF